MAALGLGDTEVGHGCAPLGSMRPDPAMADMGHQVRDLVGDRPCDKGIGLVVGDLEVVADTAMQPPVDRLSSGLAAQIEADLDPFRGALPGGPEEGFRQGEILFGCGPQPLGESKSRSGTGKCRLRI